jgi:hypothetical protein
MRNVSVWMKRQITWGLGLLLCATGLEVPKKKFLSIKSNDFRNSNAVKLTNG